MLARGAALAVAIGLGAAACSSSPRTEQGSRPDAAGKIDGGADARTRSDGTRSDAAVPEAPDFDRDDVPDDEDICIAGDDNDDTDGDDLPRACDPCPNTRPEDGRSPAEDNDGDGVGTRCDLDDTPVTGFDPSNTDDDLDHVLDRNDNCGEPNGVVATADCDGDGIADPPGQVDCDEDGVGTPCDCDDNNPSVHPSVAASIPPVPEVADTPGDGVDSDCDGVGQQVGFPNADGTVVITGEPTYTCIVGTVRDDPDGISIGECEVGAQTCMSFPCGSAFGPVEGHVDAVPEVCDGMDNDCDGSNDEEINCNCVSGDTQECGEDEGICEPGEQTCLLDRTWGECEGAIGPTASSETLCDGEDENCDGVADENFGVGDSCIGIGACGIGGAGAKECASPTTTRCDINPGGSADRSTAEVCDTVDNDCDGSLNEGTYSVVGGNENETAAWGTACNLPQICGPGTYRCADTGAVECNSVDNRVQNPGFLESSTLCNGADDDCDSAVDEGCSCITGNTRACGESTGECSEGVQTCTADAWGDCVGAVGPTLEICDGLDNNCDEIPDNGFGVGDTCRGRGECGVDDPATPADEGLGLVECANQTRTRCNVNRGGTSDQSIAEIPDNERDDDCDGYVDE